MPAAPADAGAYHAGTGPGPHGVRPGPDQHLPKFPSGPAQEWSSALSATLCCNTSAMGREHATHPSLSLSAKPSGTGGRPKFTFKHLPRPAPPRGSRDSGAAPAEGWAPRHRQGPGPLLRAGGGPGADAASRQPAEDQRQRGRHYMPADSEWGVWGPSSETLSDLGRLLHQRISISLLTTRNSAHDCQCSLPCPPESSGSC